MKRSWGDAALKDGRDVQSEAMMVAQRDNDQRIKAKSVSVQLGRSQSDKTTKLVSRRITDGTGCAHLCDTAPVPIVNHESRIESIGRHEPWITNASRSLCWLCWLLECLTARLLDCLTA